MQVKSAKLVNHTVYYNSLRLDKLLKCCLLVCCTGGALYALRVRPPLQRVFQHQVAPRVCLLRRYTHTHPFVDIEHKTKGQIFLLKETQQSYQVISSLVILLNLKARIQLYLDGVTRAPELSQLVLLVTQNQLLDYLQTSQSVDGSRALTK